MVKFGYNSNTHYIKDEKAWVYPDRASNSDFDNRDSCCDAPAAFHTGKEFGAHEVVYVEYVTAWAGASAVFR